MKTRSSAEVQSVAGGRPTERWGIRRQSRRCFSFSTFLDERQANFGLAPPVAPVRIVGEHVPFPASHDRGHYQPDWRGDDHSAGGAETRRTGLVATASG